MLSLTVLNHRSSWEEEGDTRGEKGIGEESFRRGGGRESLLSALRWFSASDVIRCANGRCRICGHESRTAYTAEEFEITRRRDLFVRDHG